jgi:dTDP-4-dehydrorhamnose reductase
VTGRNRQRIAVVGSRGRLGAAVARHLESLGHPVIRFDRQALDLSEPSRLDGVLSLANFDLLVNCAALTNVDYCEEHPAEAAAANAEAPAAIAEHCARRGARLVHVSTDYVYLGEDPAPRRESDPAEPASEYGRSKLRGDQAVLAADPGFLAIRTSWVFGPDRDGFLETMLGRALRGEPVEAIADKFSSPTYSLDFAELLEPLLDHPGGGALNLCNAGACSWHQYAQAAIDAALACGVPLRTTRASPTRLSEMSQFLAPRPVHTAMDTSRYSALTGRHPRPWNLAVHDYIASTWVHRPR